MLQTKKGMGGSGCLVRLLGEWALYCQVCQSQKQRICAPTTLIVLVQALSQVSPHTYRRAHIVLLSRYIYCLLVDTFHVCSRLGGDCDDHVLRFHCLAVGNEATAAPAAVCVHYFSRAPTPTWGTWHDVLHVSGGFDGLRDGVGRRHPATATRA